MKIAGIYKITCKIKNEENHNKFYIGSSKDIKDRWYNHKLMLNNGNHPNIHLQRAWNKYGENNFIFEVIECIIDINYKYIYEREQFYLDNLYPFNNNGYNINKNATGGLNLNWMKPILQYDLKGNFIKEYESIIETSKYFKNHSTIGEVCRGHNKTSHGFIWKYKTSNNIPLKIEPMAYKAETLIINKQYDRNKHKLKDIKVCVYNLKGCLLNVYDTSKKCSENENELLGNINSCISQNNFNRESGKYAQRNGKIYLKSHLNLILNNIKTGHKILEKINILNNNVDKEYIMMTECAKDLEIKKEVLDGWIKRQVIKNGYFYKYKQY